MKIIEKNVEEITEIGTIKVETSVGIIEFSFDTGDEEENCWRTLNIEDRDLYEKLPKKEEEELYTGLFEAITNYKE